MLQAITGHITANYITVVNFYVNENTKNKTRFLKIVRTKQKSSASIAIRPSQHLKQVTRFISIVMD